MTTASPPRPPTRRLPRRVVSVAVAAGLAAVALSTRADVGSGLSTPAVDWSGWSSRTSLTIWTPVAVPGWRADLFAGDGVGLKLRSVGFIGDYYLHESTTASGYTGGFRASSGLLIGPAGANWAAGGSVSSGLGANLGDGASEPTAVPYVGVGYSGLSLRGGWGFTADLGVLARGASAGLRLGRTSYGISPVDELSHDLQLRPLVRLGASYSF